MNVLIDILLAILTVYLALQSLLAPRLSQSVFIFFAFGLALALTWVRLGAVDVAITEAAIAAGLMGVLFLDALRDFSPAIFKKQNNLKAVQNPPSKKDTKSHLLPGLALGSGLGLFLLIALEAVWKIPVGGGLTAATRAMLPESGVGHPVTAVLLNFRAYDTLLEIGVILIGLLAIFAVGGINLYLKPGVAAKDPLLRQAILFSTPVLFLFGAFILYFGKTGPGGAFQAAVLWGAIGIMLHLGGWPVFPVIPRWLRQLILTVGPGFFLLLGFLFMAGGGAMLEYPPAYAGVLILTVETLAAISIAAALTAMFANLNQMKKEEPNEVESTK
ncbi:MAG: hydrogenase subunit MbhD domain-containing protein [Bacteroidales bacterium]